MNRKIKFRGIPLDGFVPTDEVDFDGEFIYGYYMKNGKDYLIISGTIEPSDNLPCPKWFVDVDPKTVGQFTGLKDVNDKEIYIGDIVKVWSDMSELTMAPVIDEVISEDTLGRPGVFLKPVGPHVIEPCIYESWNNKFKIIGNVHDNPELLEGDSDD